MSLFPASFRRVAAGPIVQRRLNETVGRYACEVRNLTFHCERGVVSAEFFMLGIAGVQVTARLLVRDEDVHLAQILSAPDPIRRVFDAHFKGVKLPLPPENARQLASLWPD